MLVVYDHEKDPEIVCHTTKLYELRSPPVTEEKHSSNNHYVEDFMKR